jgi:ammonia channel protein AmtB
MGGLVGNVDKVGAVIIGVVAAVLIYAALSRYESSQQRYQ